MKPKPADQTVVLHGNRSRQQANGARAPVSLQWGGHTDRGPRSENQDSYSLPRDAERGALVVVCDGVGGAAGGREAAQIAATAAQHAFYSDNGPTSSRERLEWAISQANQAIVRHAERSRQPQMATTVVAACVHDDHLYVAYAGDSRAYIFRKGRLRLLTSDHSMVVEDANRGLVAMSEMGQVGYRNIITRSLGPASNSQLDYRLEVLKPGDRVLLCTDGLYTALSDEQIERVLNRPLSAQQAAELLVKQAARSPNAKDNVTAAVLDYGAPAAAFPLAGKPLFWLSRVAVVVALIAVGVVVWRLIATPRSQPPPAPNPTMRATSAPAGSNLLPLGAGGGQATPTPPAASAPNGAAGGFLPQATATLAAPGSTPTSNPAAPAAIARTPTPTTQPGAPPILPSPTPPVQLPGPPPPSGGPQPPLGPPPGPTATPVTPSPPPGPTATPVTPSPPPPPTATPVTPSPPPPPTATPVTPSPPPPPPPTPTPPGVEP